MSDPLLLGMLADARDLQSALSSPLGAVPSALTGGVSLLNTIGTSANAKVYPVVKIDCADARVCFGKIGAGGSAFCVRTDCTVKAHGELKMPFRGRAEVFVFISQYVGSTVFVDPTLRAAQVPPDVWNVWDETALTLKSWRREFQAVESNDDAGATVEDIKRETRFLDNAEKFRTPAKRKREANEEDSKDSQMLADLKSIRFERFLPHKSLQKEEFDEVVEFGLKPEVLITVVSDIETSLVSMSEGLEEVSILAGSRFLANEVDIKMLSAAIGDVRSAVGSVVDMDPSFASPTMWGTISFIADELSKVGAKIKDSIEAFAPFRTMVGVKFGEAKESSDTTVKILGMLMKSIKALTAENEVVKTWVHEVKRRLAESALRPDGRSPKSQKLHARKEETVDDLMDMMCSNTITSERRWNDSDDPQDEDATMYGNSHKKAVRAPTTNVDHHPLLSPENLQKFYQLLEDVSVLKIAAEATAIKFGNLGLRNLQECSRWVQQHFRENRYGLVVDPLVMLDRIFGNDDVDPMTQLKTLESRLKLNIETGAEASAITSLSHSRPRIFHSGRPTMSCDQHTSRLNKLCNHAKWKTGGEGVRNYIIKQMNVLQSSISSDIIFAFGHDPECAKAQMIATLSLTASVAFITQLLNYIDALFEKLHVYSKFTVETGWSLSMQVLDRIVSDLFAPKEGVANGMQGDRASICSHIIWASLRSHDIAQVYLDHNFENHPAISSEFIKFLATNSGFEKVEKISDQVEIVKAKASASLEASKTAATKADSASSKCSDAVRDLATLTRRVKVLEDRGSR